MLWESSQTLPMAICRQAKMCFFSNIISCFLQSFFFFFIFYEERNKWMLVVYGTNKWGEKKCTWKCFLHFFKNHFPLHTLHSYNSQYRTTLNVFLSLTNEATKHYYASIMYTILYKMVEKWFFFVRNEHKKT